MPPPAEWSFERKISLASVALAIVLPIGGYVWSTSAAFSRLGIVEKEHSAQSSRIDTIESSRHVMSERTVRLEQQAIDIKEALRRIEGKVDRLGERH
jgi:hypothetical protein